MLRLFLFTTAIALTGAGSLAGDIPPERLRQVDRLHDQDRHSEALETLATLEGEAESAADRAAIIWRQARARFSEVDLGLYAGELTESEAMETLEAIEATAAQAVELAADSGNGALESRAHFWRGAAMAKRGELRGILNALFMADDLLETVRRSVEEDESYANPYYVAGQVYNQVPGFPIAFGDKVAAVSYSRKSIDLHEEQLEEGVVTVRYWDFYVKLAAHLDGRGWSAGRRSRNRSSARQAYEEAPGPFEAAAHYEGVAQIPDYRELSDREEAQDILRFVIDGIESLSERGVREERTLEEARGLLR